MQKKKIDALLFVNLRFQKKPKQQYILLHFSTEKKNLIKALMMAINPPSGIVYYFGNGSSRVKGSH